MKYSVRIKKLNKNARTPSYGSECAAGADLCACTDGKKITIAPHTSQFIHTGIAVEIPTGFAGLVYARSGIACKRSLAPANKVGVIDSDYRGEIMVVLHNHSDEEQYIEDGERIAQLVITPYVTAVFDEVDELFETTRGEGGFGSTGRK